MYNDSSGHNDEIEVKRCSDCDLAFTYPDIAELSSLYIDRNTNDFQPDDGAIARRLKDWAFQREARGILKGLPLRPDVVIDYGCGDGRITNALAEFLGDTATVIGADFQQTAPDEIGRKKIVEYCSYGEARSYLGRCDLVVCRHALEHASDPIDFLKGLKLYLRDGGLLFIEVPNSKTPWATIFGKYWEGWYTPFHRTHFSRRSLRECLELSGFDIVDEAGAEMPLMGRTIRNMTAYPYNSLFFLTGLVLQPIQHLMAIVTRQPVCLRIVASNRA